MLYRCLKGLHGHAFYSAQMRCCCSDSCVVVVPIAASLLFKLPRRFCSDCCIVVASIGGRGYVLDDVLYHRRSATGQLLFKHTYWRTGACDESMRPVIFLSVLFLIVCFVPIKCL